jgi:S1-C subfamily serine protease
MSHTESIMEATRGARRAAYQFSRGWVCATQVSMRCRATSIWSSALPEAGCGGVTPALWCAVSGAPRARHVSPAADILDVMCLRWIVAAVLLVPIALAGQETGVLRVRITLLDPEGQPTPVARHALLISDHPVTRAPRVVRTARDGTVEVTLRPGSYVVESERAVMFQGQGYEWFQSVDVAAGQEVTLELTSANAEAGELPAGPGTPSPDTDPLFHVGQWQNSVVAIWSPTSRATGFLVDARGLIATHRDAVGRATTVAVQVSDTLKVPARVVFSDASSAVAVVWVSPDAMSGRPPVALDCPPTQAPSVSDDEELVTIAAELGRPTDVMRGRVTSLRPRAIDTDLRLSFGGAGGPVFNEAGGVVGLTSARVDPESRWHETEMIRAVHVCEALFAARSALTAATPPEATPLPVEPARPFPASALEGPVTSARADAPPSVVTSEDFEIAFITPPAISYARQKGDWTGGRSTRAPETEARLGRLTDFGAWSPYFLDAPAVLVVRVTPRMVEGFWKRVAREAARTQGADLPPFKHFKGSFAHLTMSCGATTVPPIQPFVLEHQLSETDTIREGVYVFGPDAVGPSCGEVRLTLHAETTSGKPDAIVLPPPLVERIWNDFAAWRDVRP